MQRSNTAPNLTTTCLTAYSSLIGKKAENNVCNNPLTRNIVDRLFLNQLCFGIIKSLHSSPSTSTITPSPPTATPPILLQGYHENCVYESPLVTLVGPQAISRGVARINRLLFDKIDLDLLLISESVRAIGQSSSSSSFTSNTSTKTILLEINHNVTLRPFTLLSPLLWIHGSSSSPATLLSFSYKTTHKMVIVASSSSHPLQLDQPRVIRHEEIFSVKDLVLMIPFIGYVYDVARAFISNYLVKEEVDKDSSSDCCSVVEEVDLDLAKAC